MLAVRRPFYAAYDADASWLDQLVPAFGAPRFFFEREGLPRAHRRLTALQSAS